MSAPPAPRRRVAGIRPGDELPQLESLLDSARVLRYAQASGDANPIHRDAGAADSAGLPGVVGHGMLTLAIAGAALCDWAGDPGSLVELRARFSRPVVVPAGGAVAVTVGGVVTAVDPTSGLVDLELRVRCDGVSVLARAGAVVRLLVGE